MKITVIISAMLIAQVSASFFDVFQGAMQSVQNGFGKLFSDVVTDVKDTVDCTILAVEHVLSLSEDATARYYDKCGSGTGKNSSGTDAPMKDGNSPTVEISISNNKEYLKEKIPEEIDARINATLTKFLSGYNPHDRLEDVEIGLTKETQRLADVSELVKQELDKLSSEIKFDFKKFERNDSKPSIDTILEELKLLEAIEQNVRNTSEANEVHKVIDDVLHKLNAIESSEAAENARVERILKDLENNTNSSYTDLRQQLKDLREEEAIHLDLIKYKMEEHEKSSAHMEFIRDTKFNNTMAGADVDFKNINNGSTTVINVSLYTKQPETIHNENYNPKGSKNKTILGDIQLDVTSNSTSTNISSITPQPLYINETVSNVTTYSRTLSVIPTVPTIDKPKGLTSMGSHKTGSMAATENIFTESTTKGPGPLAPRSPRTDIDEHTRDHGVHDNKTTSTPVSVTTTVNKKLSSSTTNQPKTAPENLESRSVSAESNDNSKSTFQATTTKSKVVISTTSEHGDPFISTLIIENQQTGTSSVQINDASVTTAPYVIMTNSYANPNNHANDTTTLTVGKSSVSTTIPHTSISLTTPSRISNQAQLFNHVLNETLKSTTVFVPTKTTTVELISTTITPMTTPKIIRQKPAEGRVQISDHDSQEMLKTSVTAAHSESASIPTTPLVARTVNETLTTMTPPVTSTRILAQQQVSHRAQINDYDSMLDNVTTTERPHITESTTCAFCDLQSSAATEKTIHSPTQPPTVPIPSLDAYLKYIDHVITTSTLPPTIKPTESPATPLSTHASKASSERVYNEHPLFDRSNHNNGLHESPGFMPPQSVPSLQATNIPTIPMTREITVAKLVPPQIMHNEPLPYSKILPPSPHSPPSTYTRNNPIDPMNMPAPLLLLPSFSMPAQGPYNNSPPYVRSNPIITPVNGDALSNTPLSRLIPLQSGYPETPPYIGPSNFENRPPVTINERLIGLTTNSPLSTPKTNNFDDPDYDSLFHIPAKDTEAHDQALRDARKLIEDSERAHRIIDSILNKNTKGRSVFGSPKTLNTGK